MAGRFAVTRSSLDHPIFGNDPYCKRAAWYWLIGNAAWKPMRVYVGSKCFDLERGQLVASYRYLASAWGWTLKRVRTWLATVQREDMIRLEKGTGITVITVCNYDTYQFASEQEGTDRAQQGHSRGTARAQQGHKEEEVNKDKKVRKTDTSVSVYSPEFERFWKAYPRRVEKKAALAAFVKARKNVELEPLLAAVERYAAEATPGYTKYPASWLNKECWLDEPAPKSRPPPRNHFPETDTAVTRRVAKEFLNLPPDQSDEHKPRNGTTNGLEGIGSVSQRALANAGNLLAGDGNPASGASPGSGGNSSSGGGADAEDDPDGRGRVGDAVRTQARGDPPSR